jgi:hypothetical protein
MAPDVASYPRKGLIITGAAIEIIRGFALKQCRNRPEQG